MKATAFEFRFRILILSILCVVGFTAPWNYAVPVDSIRAWQWMAAWATRGGWIGFSAATISVLGVGILFTFVAALLRTWASAYLGASIVRSSDLHGDRVVGDGPYRYTRNPLYLGLWVHTLALALLMPPTGAMFCILAVGFFELRLIASEESFLAATLGEPYLAYLAKVPRVVPSLAPRIPVSGARPGWGWGWGAAVLGELYFWGVFVSFAALGWRYNALVLLQGVLISLGVSIVVRAFLPKAGSPPLPSL